MAVIILAVNALHKSGMEYHGKFGHNLGRIQRIDIIDRIDICYKYCRLWNQNVAPTLPVFQDIKKCIQYLARHTHKLIFNPYNYYDGLNVTQLTWNENQVEDYMNQNSFEYHQNADHVKIINRRWSFRELFILLLGLKSTRNYIYNLM